MNIYVTFSNTTINYLASTLESLLPENQHQLVELGTVWLSDGDIFECSVEPNADQLYLSGEVKLDQRESMDWVKDFVQKLKTKFNQFQIDWEWEEDGNFKEESFIHQG